MTSTNAIELHGLTKRYGTRTAVDDLTASIPAGKVTGFIGPNGAGKTTTMAMLLGLVAPSAGGGHVLGEPLDRPGAFLGRVGALIEGPAFWPSLTGEENLRALAALAGHDAARVPAVLGVVGLRQRGGDRYGTYSLGMKQRLGIGAAMLGDPELLVLDEPVNGLDPTGITEMRQLIGELAAEGRTVLVSSHLLSELEQIADWLLIIDHGRAVYEGTTSDLTSGTPPTVVLQPDRPEDIERLVGVIEDAAADAGLLLREVTVKQPALESRYLTMVEGGDR